MKMETTNSRRYNSQYSEAYIVYMIIGSYFADCVCSNELEEKHLYLHYKEMPANRQLRDEKSVIDFFERHYRDLIVGISGLKCEAFFRKLCGNYYVCFDTGFERIMAVISPEGKFDIMVSNIFEAA